MFQKNCKCIVYLHNVKKICLYCLQSDNLKHIFLLIFEHLTFLLNKSTFCGGGGGGGYFTVIVEVVRLLWYRLLTYQILISASVKDTNPAS